MNRESIIGIFEGATDAQVDAAMELAVADMAALQAQLDEAQEEIARLKDAADALQEENEAAQLVIAQLQGAEDARMAAQREETERAAVLKRMEAVMDGRRFVHERIRDMVAQEFGEMLKVTRGMTDREVLNALTRGKGYFVTRHAPAHMAPVGEIPHEQMESLPDADFYARVFRSQTAKR